MPPMSQLAQDLMGMFATDPDDPGSARQSHEVQDSEPTINEGSQSDGDSAQPVLQHQGVVEPLNEPLNAARSGELRDPAVRRASAASQEATRSAPVSPGPPISSAPEPPTGRDSPGRPDSPLLWPPSPLIPPKPLSQRPRLVLTPPIPPPPQLEQRLSGALLTATSVTSDVANGTTVANNANTSNASNANSTIVKITIVKITIKNTAVPSEADASFARICTPGATNATGTANTGKKGSLDEEIEDSEGSSTASQPGTIFQLGPAFQPGPASQPGRAFQFDPAFQFGPASQFDQTSQPSTASQPNTTFQSGTASQPSTIIQLSLAFQFDPAIQFGPASQFDQTSQPSTAHLSPNAEPHHQAAEIRSNVRQVILNKNNLVTKDKETKETDLSPQPSASHGSASQQRAMCVERLRHNLKNALKSVTNVPNPVTDAAVTERTSQILAPRPVPSTPQADSISTGISPHNTTNAAGFIQDDNKPVTDATVQETNPSSQPSTLQANRHSTGISSCNITNPSTFIFTRNTNKPVVTQAVTPKETSPGLQPSTPQASTTSVNSSPGNTTNAPPAIQNTNNEPVTQAITPEGTITGCQPSTSLATTSVNSSPHIITNTSSIIQNVNTPVTNAAATTRGTSPGSQSSIQPSTPLASAASVQSFPRNVTNALLVIQNTNEPVTEAVATTEGINSCSQTSAQPSTLQASTTSVNSSRHYPTNPQQASEYARSNRRSWVQAPFHTDTPADTLADDTDFWQAPREHKSRGSQPRGILVNNTTSAENSPDSSFQSRQRRPRAPRKLRFAKDEEETPTRTGSKEDNNNNNNNNNTQGSVGEDMHCLKKKLNRAQRSRENATEPDAGKGNAPDPNTPIQLRAPLRIVKPQASLPLLSAPGRHVPSGQTTFNDRPAGVRSSFYHDFGFSENDEISHLTPSRPALTPERVPIPAYTDRMEAQKRALMSAKAKGKMKAVVDTNDEDEQTYAQPNIPHAHAGPSTSRAGPSTYRAGPSTYRTQPTTYRTQPTTYHAQPTGPRPQPTTPSPTTPSPTTPSYAYNSHVQRSSPHPVMIARPVGLPVQTQATSTTPDSSISEDTKEPAWSVVGASTPSKPTDHHRLAAQAHAAGVTSLMHPVASPVTTPEGPQPQAETSSIEASASSLRFNESTPTGPWLFGAQSAADLAEQDRARHLAQLARQQQKRERQEQKKAEAAEKAKAKEEKRMKEKEAKAANNNGGRSLRHAFSRLGLRAGNPRSEEIEMEDFSRKGEKGEGEKEKKEVEEEEESSEVEVEELVEMQENGVYSRRQSCPQIPPLDLGDHF
ncbi:hypothetical protein MGN70_009267 [Eutypa lata]|nr:hypothetical protein MGN70_009267 [Eutypa lata]